MGLMYSSGESLTAKSPVMGVNCYSESEASFMAHSRALRVRIMGPLLRLLDCCGVTPNQVTLLSLLAGLMFCPLFAWNALTAAYIMLVLHALLDAIDGPLARYQGSASSQGSITDTMADQLVVTFTTLALIAAGIVGTWVGGLYIFAYSVVVIFAMIRSALSIPYCWLIRPRFIIYLWIPLEMSVWDGSLDVLMWISTALLAVNMLTGFIRIRRLIPLTRYSRR